MITKLALATMAFIVLLTCASDPRPAISGAVADSVPTWLGGMPKDVPPRPGTVEYDAWQKKRAEEAATENQGSRNRSRLHWKGRGMSNNILLAICAALVCCGIFTIAVSPGFFMQLLGAGMLGTGGAAAYLILSHRSEKHRN